MNGFKKLNHVRLAEGEATGHYHSATSQDAVLWESSSGTRVLDASSGTEIVHQEHGPIRLNPGNYDVTKVVEYDHFLEESRSVVD